MGELGLNEGHGPTATPVSPVPDPPPDRHPPPFSTSPTQSPSSLVQQGHVQSEEPIPRRYCRRSFLVRTRSGVGKNEWGRRRTGYRRHWDRRRPLDQSPSSGPGTVTDLWTGVQTRLSRVERHSSTPLTPVPPLAERTPVCH